MVKITIKANENGPYVVEKEGNVIAALCRCDNSKNKPYCDGTHAKVGFKAKVAEIAIADA